MRHFLFVFTYDDNCNLYEMIAASSAVMANLIFEREWPNATLKHIQVIG